MDTVSARPAVERSMNIPANVSDERGCGPSQLLRNDLTVTLN